MEIQRLNGISNDVYCTIGKYAMNKSIIKSLGNPITTSIDSSWYLIYRNKKLTAFFSLEVGATIFILKNLVCLEVSIEKLIPFITPVLKVDLEGHRFDELTTYVRIKDIKVYEKEGFTLKKKRVNWATMKIKI